MSVLAKPTKKTWREAIYSAIVGAEDLQSTQSRANH